MSVKNTFMKEGFRELELTLHGKCWMKLDYYGYVFVSTRDGQLPSRPEQKVVLELISQTKVFIYKEGNEHPRVIEPYSERLIVMNRIKTPKVRPHSMGIHIDDHSPIENLLSVIRTATSSNYKAEQGGLTKADVIRVLQQVSDEWVPARPERSRCAN